MSVLHHLLAGVRCTHPGCRGAASTPIWVPRWLGELHTAHGPDATLHLDVRNASAWSRTLTVESDSPRALPEVAALQLAPHSARSILVALTDADGVRDPLDALIRVRGAHEHQLRWVVRAAKGLPRRTGATIVDAPVLVHEWSDHFSASPP
ncbi:hypothetical protein [Actinomycetospora aeridis]|uniref:Uncharacterized protein n=1 Tax=Actinomycetospora aeridis TaxID=3129231 RepID=A0ABU8N9X7_9PSEU